jgi:hypothetical protein
LGRAAAEGRNDNEEIVGDQAADEPLVGNNDKKIIDRKARLIMFRDGKISESAFQENICPGLAPSSYKFSHWRKYVKETQLDLQARMFCSKALQTKVGGFHTRVETVD